MTSPLRPPAQDFLELFERGWRGRLKIYLGYAPGLGKTCRMLEEASALRARGIDLVGAWVDGRGRPATEALVRDLELVPRRRVTYRGIEAQELDLDAVLARKPAIALVDDLAHTNLPGARNPRRWQDVLELLRARISVIGTLDVRQVEPVREILERELGLRERETVPRGFLEEADQIISVDLAPEEAEARLRSLAASVNPGTRERLLQPGTLARLQELARQEAAVAGGRRAVAIERKAEPAGAAHGRVMAAVSGNAARASVLLRRAQRVAERLDTSWFAVHVEPLRAATARRDAGREPPIAASLDQARSLGGEVVRLHSDDPAAALLDFARARGVSDLFMGRARPVGWARLLRPSVFRRLVDGAAGIDLHVISFGGDAEAP